MKKNMGNSTYLFHRWLTCLLVAYCYSSTTLATTIPITTLLETTSLAATTADDLRQQATEYMHQFIKQKNLIKTQFEIGKIDPRLQLAACTTPLKIELFNPPTPLSGRVTLQINCTTPSPWKIYVKANVHAFKSVVVAARPLARGLVITQEDVRIQEKPLETLKQNYFEQPSAVIGKSLKYAVASDSVLNATALNNPKLVSKNQQVTITSGASSTIQVKTTGIALRDGSAGERIPVRNRTSNKMIEATVLAPGLVGVNP